MRRLAIFLPLVTFSAANAADTLPYSIRTKSYSGWSSIVHGDTITIGMAGATVAIPHSISSAESNPAGLTMTMGSVSAQINSNSMEDRRVSDSGRITSSQWGLAISPPPWGYSISYYSPSYEGGTYRSVQSGRPHLMEVSLKQLRATVTRTLFDNQMSAGVSLELNKAVRQISDESYDGHAANIKIGAIYKLKKHWLIGLAFSPPVEVGSPDLGSSAYEVPGFAHSVKVPYLVSLGTGWIPNRHFRFGASVIGVGSTANTALLRDEKMVLGKAFTLQPRIGATYVVAEYHHFKIEAAAGSYYEVSRIEAFPNRLHGTFGLEVNPWFINTGFGIDRAENYNNLSVSIGVDIVRLLRTFDLIPRDSVPPFHGFFPPIQKIQADGLPDALVAGEKREYEAPSVGDVGKIIRDIPKRFEDKFDGPNDPVPDEMKPARKSRTKKKPPPQTKEASPSEKAKPSDDSRSTDIDL